MHPHPQSARSRQVALGGVAALFVKTVANLGRKGGREGGREGKCIKKQQDSCMNITLSTHTPSRRRIDK
jgi:hypothetical protein